MVVNKSFERDRWHAVEPEGCYPTLSVTGLIEGPMPNASGYDKLV